MHALAAFAILIAAASAVTAQETEPPIWDFSGARQPKHEISPIFEPPDEYGCGKWPDQRYEQYAKLHPQFRPLMADPQMRRRWRQSLILATDNQFDYQNACFYQKLSLHTNYSISGDLGSQIIYCGMIPPGLDQHKRRWAQEAHELTEYGMIGRSLAAYTVLVTYRNHTNFKLNADVYYYIQRVFRRQLPPWDQSREIYADVLAPDFGDLLTAERRQFVDDAFERGDYRAVLATTELCPIIPAKLGFDEFYPLNPLAYIVWIIKRAFQYLSR